MFLINYFIATNIKCLTIIIIIIINILKVNKTLDWLNSLQ